MSVVKKLLSLVKKPQPRPQKEQPVERVPIQINLLAFNDNFARHFGKAFHVSQLDGTYLINTNFYYMGGSDLRHLAYILATAYHETAFSMRPVTEYGGEKYLKSKKYYPYHGRGYVQITWRENYEKYGIADDPEKALIPEVAAYILIHGMINGIFTGRKLRDYFNDTKTDPFNARKIINGLDSALKIEEYYHDFLKVLQLSKTEDEFQLG